VHDRAQRCTADTRKIPADKIAEACGVQAVTSVIAFKQEKRIAEIKRMPSDFREQLDSMLQLTKEPQVSFSVIEEASQQAMLLQAAAHPRAEPVPIDPLSPL
jgi:hypothetical protein